MNRTILPLLAASIVTACLPAQAEVEKAEPRLPEPPGLEHIKADEMTACTNYLASDELGGRLTGSVGQELAAAYIAKHFESLGLEPLGDVTSKEGEPQKRGFIQKYRVIRESLGEKSVLQVGQDSFASGFAVIPAMKKPASDVDFDGKLVYAGLIGQRRFKRGAEIEDWKGKIPVFVLDLPKVKKKMAVEQQMGMGMFTVMSLKRRLPRFTRKGAKAALFCVLDDDSPVANILTYMSIGPGQAMLQKPGSSGMGAMMGMMKSTVPQVFVSRKVSLTILKAIGLTDESARQPVSEEAVAELKEPDGELKLTIEKDDKASASNVVAVLRGSDPELRDEAVIYSAHMDHVGKRFDGDAYNGADDNASGTAGLMAIAKAFAKSEKTPRRSVIFLSVSGEELGLWGSAHYANHPTWPVDKLVANINTDMIGRSGPESGDMEVTVTPSFRHKKFSTIVQDAARIGQQMGMTFKNGDKYYTRSDHYNFAQKGIPVVFFCNGEHEDYHQVTDHPEKLSGPKMERIAKMAYWTGYRVAQSDSRPNTLGRAGGWLVGDDKK